MAEPEERQAEHSTVEHAGRERREGWRAFIDFLRDNKKWWLIPLFASVLLFAVLLIVARTTAAPFVYTLF